MALHFEKAGTERPVNRAFGHDLDTIFGEAKAGLQRFSDRAEFTIVGRDLGPRAGAPGRPG
jgi:hypothetical protein